MIKRVHDAAPVPHSLAFCGNPHGPERMGAHEASTDKDE